MSGDATDDVRTLDVALRHGVSEMQYNFLTRLVREREYVGWGTTVDERLAKLDLLFRSGDLRGTNVSREIDFWLARPHAPAQPVQADDTELTPGVYALDGRIYVVKFNQVGTRLYAKRLVELQGAERVNVLNDTVNIEFVHAPGAVANLRPEHRMTVDEAERLCVRYGKCVSCGRPLKKNARSVRAGIGPVCLKMFR